jgi:carbon-monoxide dehydrogenase large subunit
MVRVNTSGAVTVYTGTSPHGQGHETGFAQIVADRLGVDPQQVEVIHGDTATGPEGLDTYGSRTLAVGGEAVARAAEKVAAKAKAIVAHQLEAAPEDIELRDGKFQVKGSPDKALTMAEIAGEAYVPLNLPEGMEPGLEEISFYDPGELRVPVRRARGLRRRRPGHGQGEGRAVRRGRRLRPGDQPAAHRRPGPRRRRAVDRQALYEQVVYDADGQLVTGTFVDYALPTANEIPSFETDRTETPSPTNTLGVKGVGEAGTIAATASVTNAVIDALRPLGVTYVDMPLTPMRHLAGDPHRRRPARHRAGARARRARRRGRRLRTDHPAEGGAQ